MIGTILLECLYAVSSGYCAVNTITAIIVALSYILGPTYLHISMENMRLKEGPAHLKRLNNIPLLQPSP